MPTTGSVIRVACARNRGRGRVLAELLLPLRAEDGKHAVAGVLPVGSTVGCLLCHLGGKLYCTRGVCAPADVQTNFHTHSAQHTTNEGRT